MKAGKKSNLLLLFLTLLLCLGCITPAFAAPTGGTGGTGGLDIQVSGSSGITINPGNYPDLSSGDLSGVQDEVSEKVVSKSKSVAQTVTAICAIVCMVFFFINVVKLATSGSMAFQRRTALIGLLWSGVALALFGGGWTVITFFWNFLN